MPNEELFSGIPSLDDTQGLESYMSNATLESMGLGDGTSVPGALQTNETPSTTESNEENVPIYTADQVQQIIANAQAQAQQQAQAQYYQAMQQQQAAAATQRQQSPYTPRQQAIIKELIDRGVPMERIQQALNGNRQDNAMMQRLQNVEAYLQNQQYLAEQNAFIDKMTAFGDKFGLTENDLVTFGNKAMTMGINLTTVSDIETVFRAVYPDQYAIRSQRLAGASSAPIYGGSNTPEAPRAASSRMEDAYVDQFLKRSMPNQYGMNTK